MRMRPPAQLLALGMSALVGACAGGAPPAVTPQDVQALEAESARRPTDAALITRLGIAYYTGKNYQRAREVLQGSLVLDKASYPTNIYLGLANEQLGTLDSARVAYNRASALATSQKQRGEIADRLALLTRKELRQAAREAVARESTLSTQPAIENTVAVFPFRYLGTDDQLRPLERGLTHLVITDLGKISRLRLLERERVQALVDELALSEEGRVDPATGARSGRMLRAASVVQGALQDVPAEGQLKLDANVVSAASADVSATGSASDRLQQLFDMEKRVVSQLLQRMGIALTPAEQRAVSERPTADLQAFLAFSRGLEAEDNGDFAGAASAFNAAVARDPNFRTARDRSATVQRLDLATGLAPAQFAGTGLSTTSSAAGEGGISGTAATLQSAVAVTVPSVGGGILSRLGPTQTNPPAARPPLPEALGTDITPGGLFGTIVIIVTRP